MPNFIFKSQGLIKNIDNKLIMIQSELRHQRSDNVQIIYLLNKLLTNKNLQKQVNEYFNSGLDDGTGETSPQTESDEQ